eukprot:Opistho-1_new@99638
MAGTRRLPRPRKLVLREANANRRHNVQHLFLRPQFVELPKVQPARRQQRRVHQLVRRQVVAIVLRVGEAAHGGRRNVCAPRRHPKHASLENARGQGPRASVALLLGLSLRRLHRLRLGEPAVEQVAGVVRLGRVRDAKRVVRPNAAQVGHRIVDLAQLPVSPTSLVLLIKRPTQRLARLQAGVRVRRRHTKGTVLRKRRVVAVALLSGFVVAVAAAIQPARRLLRLGIRARLGREDHLEGPVAARVDDAKGKLWLCHNRGKGRLHCRHGPPQGNGAAVVALAVLLKLPHKRARRRRVEQATRLGRDIGSHAMCHGLRHGVHGATYTRRPQLRCGRERSLVRAPVGLNAVARSELAHARQLARRAQVGAGVPELADVAHLRQQPRRVSNASAGDGNPTQCRNGTVPHVLCVD